MFVELPNKHGYINVRYIINFYKDSNEKKEFMIKIVKRDGSSWNHYFTTEEQRDRELREFAGRLNEAIKNIPERWEEILEGLK